MDTAADSLKKNQTLITALTAVNEKYSKSTDDNSKKAKDLDTAIKALSSTAQQHQKQTAQNQAAVDASSKSLEGNAKQAENLQKGLQDVSGSLKDQKEDVDQSAAAFDAHKDVMKHLKTSFDEIKGVSGEFGPSLQDAAKGFDMMKGGLAVVKDGLSGVGDAMKADGFDFLLQILQQIFDAFIHSSQGSKMLQDAISAIGVVVNKVKAFFTLFTDAFVKAVSHPIDSLKALGTIIEQNIINRFKAFSVILDGIIHLDFKKMADGAIQAISGVTNATGKIAATVKAVTDVVASTGTEIGKAYEDGVAQAQKALNKLKPSAVNNKKNKEDSINIDTGSYKKHQPGTTNDKQSSPPLANFSPSKQDKDSDDPTAELNNAQQGLDEERAKKQQEDAKKLTAQIISDSNTQKNENQKKEEALRKAHNKQIEDEAKQAAQQIAAVAISMLENSIKQQAEAKVAALENEKESELSNTSLTSAQKLALQAKFKKQEDQIKAKAFKEEQELNIAKTLMAAAQAAIKLWADPGFPGAIAQTVVLGAETAAQIAQIAAQKPPAYAAGGLHYQSDGRGGMLPGYSRTDNTNAYLRSGEGIVVSEAMRDPWARNLVSAINVGFGGRDFSTNTTGKGFAVGGIFTDGGDANRYYNQPVNDQKNLANTIAYQMVNNFPPVYVDVKDINSQQNILAQTINRVTL